MFANGDEITDLWQKWTIGRRLIRLLFPTELLQMVGIKLGIKPASEWQPMKGKSYRKPKIIRKTIDKFYDSRDKHPYTT